MSTVTLTMPRLGETMEEGTVSDWLVAEGAAFERGAPLVEFETDKTAVEYPALGPGRLVKALVAPGDLVKLGTPIAEIALEGAEDWVSATAEPVADPAQDGGETVIVDLPMPRLGETMEEGRVLGWMIEPGAAYARGTAILEVETDKTVAEFPALVAGRLVEVLVEEGTMVKVGTPIARIEVARSDAPEAAGDARTEAAEAVTPQTGAAPVEPSPPRPASASGSVRATPLARRAARRAGVRIETLTGTGRRGRIELRDVERAGSGALAETCFGPEAGAPVLMAHGFAGDRSTFDQLAKGLARAGLSVRTVDLPGHGETPTEAQDVDGIVAALAAELSPVRPVHLVGHSLGAAAAVLAAGRVPDGVASLTLIAPAGLGLKIDAEFIEGMAEAVSAATVGHLLRRLSKRAESFSAQTVAQIHAQLAKGRLTALGAQLAAGGRQGLNIRADLARLAQTHAVRLLTGTEDRVVDWRDALDVSPQIAVHVFPGAGHMPHWDDPQEAATLIASALAARNGARND